LDSTKEQRGIPKGSLVWRTGLSGGAPDSVRCTRGPCAQLLSLGNFQKPVRYKSPDCPVYTEQCPVLQRDAALELASLGILRRLLRYNSSDMSGVHRTVRCTSGATAISAPTATCDTLNARAARAEGRRAHTGAPDNEQDMSGVHQTSRRAQKSEAPTVRIQRH
jgi:hypothetical protein